MYDTDGMSDRPMGESMKPCKPDYEAMAATSKQNLDVVKNFRASLIDFISVIGRHSMRRREPSSLPELLGTVELDIISREREVENLLKQIEE